MVVNEILIKSEWTLARDWNSKFWIVHFVVIIVSKHYYNKGHEQNIAGNNRSYISWYKRDFCFGRKTALFYC